MSDYAKFFSNKSDDNVLKKYFYFLVNDRKISEGNAWTILMSIIAGESIELVTNGIKAYGVSQEILYAFKSAYDTQSKLEDDKRKEEAVKFRSNLNSETLDKVKNMWKELN